MSKKEEKKEIDVDKLINEYECPYMLKQGIKHYFKSVEVKSIKDFDKKLKEYLNKKLKKKEGFLLWQLYRKFK